MKATKQLLRATSILAMLATAPAWALEEIPAESGFTGVIRLSVGMVDAETNMVKGTQFWDLGKQNINSPFQAAKNEDDTFLVPGVQLVYGFGQSRTQVFLTSDIEDLITLEYQAEVGIRKQFDTLGIISLGYVGSGVVPQEVWSDPYDSSQPRNDTNREFDGVRLVWDRIAGLPIEVLFQYRDVHIDTEASGTDPALGLTPAQIASLRRDADDYRAEIGYTWRKSSRETFRPFFGYTNYDAEGDAVKNDGFYMGVDAIYKAETWGVRGFIKAGNRDADSGNPIYGGRRTDSDYYVIAVKGSYKLPWGKNLFATGALSYGEENNKVEFLDQQTLLVLAGAEWRFRPGR